MIALKVLTVAASLGSSKAVAGISAGIKGTGLKVPLASSAATHCFCKTSLSLLNDA